MEQLASNSDAAIAAHLASARAHYERGLECYVMAAEEIEAALSIESGLSYHRIGEAMGVSHTTVMRLHDWWKRGADRTDPPFGGEDARAARLARSARQAVRERPDIVREALLQDPTTARQFIRNLQKALEEQKPKPARPPRAKPGKSLLIEQRDRIDMGEHSLFIGDSRDGYFKWQILKHLGRLPPWRPPENPFRGTLEMDIVIVTDPPYGIGYPGVPNDRIAAWGQTYNLFKPRGGFSFCAFRPDEFHAAERGIRAAGGRAVHYMAMQTDSAEGSGPDGRLHNVLQSIIYWERNGATPWKQGRTAVSVLQADQWSKEDLREARNHHATPKPVNVMEKLIELITDEGDLVFDPFTGGGSTLIACERTRRRFIGIELDPSYAERAAERWQAFTGRQAMVHRFGADPVVLPLDEVGSRPGWGDWDKASLQGWIAGQE